MSRILIRDGRVIDPAQQIDRVSSLLVVDGHIAQWDVGTSVEADVVLDARDRIVAPGLIDIGTELREPGFEEDETIATGTAAAIAGGFTVIACLPNTDPPIDSQASVEFIQHQAVRADRCRVFVLACVSKNRQGEELSEMGLLAQAGAVGFSDASSPVSNSELMRRALEYSQMFNRPILNQPEVPELNRDGVMHEGFVSTLLGLPGMPAEAEDVMTARDIRLAEATGGRLHLLHISSSGSVELLRRARARGVKVTAGIAAINFALDDEALRRFDSNCKLNPPLRSADHLQACIDGLVDNTIDVICSGHSPRAAEKKMDVLDVAPYGMVGLETTLGLVATKLIRPGHLDWLQALAKLSTNPASILNLTGKGTLAVGADADVVVIDPLAKWVVDAKAFSSRSGNTPLNGWTLDARPTDVIVEGQIKRRDSNRA
jgi:dihydroorotase